MKVPQGRFFCATFLAEQYFVLESCAWQKQEPWETSELLFSACTPHGRMATRGGDEEFASVEYVRPRSSSYQLAKCIKRSS